MFVPVLLLILAAIASAILAYGTHPLWAQYSHGLGFIIFSRQFQWPLAAFAILMCLVLLGLVVSGRRRAWWLIGLGPVLALFAHRFARDNLSGFNILDNPSIVSADQASFVGDDDYVVGLVFNDAAWAYPYFALYGNPVIVQADREKRMILIWSAFANRAVAWSITRELYARDLEIVSVPANSLLVYNSKYGEFIYGITAQTHRGRKPSGFAAPIPVTKCTWREWKTKHPGTRVLAINVPQGSRIPNGPLRPWFPMPKLAGTDGADTPIALLPTTQPIALPVARLTDKPLNVSAGGLPLLIFVDRSAGQVRVFDRRFDNLAPKFRLIIDRADRRRHPQAYLIDSETNSGWLADGRAIDGPAFRQKKQLAAVALDGGLTWGIMKTWMPSLTLLSLE